MVKFRAFITDENEIKTRKIAAMQVVLFCSSVITLATAMFSK